MAANSAAQPSLWDQCLKTLELELSEQQFNTWIRPLQAEGSTAGLRLLAPNHFVVNWVQEHCMNQISAVVGGTPVEVVVGTRKPPLSVGKSASKDRPNYPHHPALGSRLNDGFTFDRFVEGKSNQLARAAAVQVGSNPGHAYNPLCIYGGVGLGKTHLMHAIGNIILERNPSAKVAYIHSERFVGDMVRGLQHNTIAEFKRAYRSLDALLIIF